MTSHFIEGKILDDKHSYFMKEVHHNFKHSDLNVYFKRNLVDEIDEEKIANDAEVAALQKYEESEAAA